MQLERQNPNIGCRKAMNLTKITIEDREGLRERKKKIQIRERKERSTEKGREEDS